MTALKKLVGCAAHLEIARSPAQCRAYCMKEATRVAGTTQEFGVFSAEKDSILSLLKTKRPLELIEQQPGLWRYVNQLKALRLSSQPKRISLTTGLLFTGQTGCGKTRIASLIASFVGDSEVYWSDGSNWWNEYDGQELVVVDEFRGQWPVQFLLRLLDRVPFMVPTKGGFVQFNSKCVIFSSNICLSKMYNLVDDATLAAVHRRIKTITF